jgi:predicted DNA-binding transcriptional regulator AlpA
MVIHPLLKLRQIIGDPKKGITPLIPVSRSAWYAGVRQGKFPQPVKLGQRAVAWRYADIAALLKRLGGEA